MEDKIFELLNSETITLSHYTGGGDEPVYVTFEYSEGWDKEEFLKDLSKRIAAIMPNQTT